jgi:hypothetical protein
MTKLGPGLIAPSKIAAETAAKIAKSFTAPSVNQSTLSPVVVSQSGHVANGRNWHELLVRGGVTVRRKSAVFSPWQPGDYQASS